MYTIRWLVDEEVVWQSTRVPVYCSLAGGGGPPVLDSGLANVLRLQPEPGSEDLHGAHRSVGKFRLKFGGQGNSLVMDGSHGHGVAHIHGHLGGVTNGHEVDLSMHTHDDNHAHHLHDHLTDATAIGGPPLDIGG
jgi:hypothetical protein